MTREHLDEQFTLILSEFEARRFGISEEDIERAKAEALPCHRDWPVPGGSHWRLQQMIPLKTRERKT